MVFGDSIYIVGGLNDKNTYNETSIMEVFNITSQSIVKIDTSLPNNVTTWAISGLFVCSLGHISLHKDSQSLVVVSCLCHKVNKMHVEMQLGSDGDDGDATIDVLLMIGTILKSNEMITYPYVYVINFEFNDDRNTLFVALGITLGCLISTSLLIIFLGPYCMLIAL